MIDAFAALVPGGGIGRYVRDLSAALLDRADAPAARFAYPRNFRAQAIERYPAQRLFEIPHPWWRLRLMYTLATMTGAGFDDLFDRPAVFHSPVGYGPVFHHTRLVAHVHDLTFLEHPEWHPRKASMFFQQTIPHAARRADTVLTHSRHVADRIVEVLGIDRARIVTIPPPLGHGFRPIHVDEARAHVKRRFGLEGDFILHVSTLEPRKNQVRLIGAFERLRQAGFRGPLLLVGQDGWRMRPILARIEASTERAAIRRILDAGDEDLVALYGACTLTAYPSIEEGFGMPLLESMACAAACVASDHAALVELAGGDAVHVSALDEQALADAMIDLWRDPARRNRLGVAGRARAESYRYERWTERIFDFYRGQLAAAGARG
jgi:alpha-1,3-rhamnosyl/mannosyltransferase